MTQPRITPSQVEVAEARRTTLPNGIGLYTLASDDFEVLRISFVFRAGSALQQAPFSASAAANLLSEGSRDMTAHQIAEQLDYYGSWYDVNVDRDYAYINFATLLEILRPDARRGGARSCSAPHSPRRSCAPTPPNADSGWRSSGRRST